MAKKLIWTTQAAQEFMDILEYWAARTKSNRYSASLVQEVDKALFLVQMQPNLGVRTGDEAVRSVLVRAYAIYYSTTPDCIEV